MNVECISVTFWLFLLPTNISAETDDSLFWTTAPPVAQDCQDSLGNDEQPKNQLVRHLRLCGDRQSLLALL